MHPATKGYVHIVLGQSSELIQSSSAKLNKNKGILPKNGNFKYNT
jgi:hypothetical protein